MESTPIKLLRVKPMAFLEGRLSRTLVRFNFKTKDVVVRTGIPNSRSEPFNRANPIDCQIALSNHPEGSVITNCLIGHKGLVDDLLSNVSAEAYEALSYHLNALPNYYVPKELDEWLEGANIQRFLSGETVDHDELRAFETDVLGYINTFEPHVTLKGSVFEWVIRKRIALRGEG